MAVRTYYGTCKTASGVSEKQVYVPDIDLAEEDFNFQEGDLLVVFFAQTNTVSEPSIVVYNQDPEQELSTTNDSGKLIKSLDVVANMENAWAAGETVIFAYTQEGTSESYYWELIDANHASVETYGDTKLFDEDKLEELLTNEEDEENSNIALTPNALKKFFDLLSGNNQQDEGSDEGDEGDEGDDEEEEPVLRVIGLNWTPVTDTELQPLGTLSLTGDSESGVQITYPLDAQVQQLIQQSLPSVPTHTGQLINNGNGSNGDGTANADPFITRMIPDDLYFGNTNGIYYGTPNSKYNMININENTITVGDQNLSSGIVLDKSTNIKGTLLVDDALTTGGTISAGSNQISTSGAVKGYTLYEGFNGSNAGTPLNQIYSKILTTAYKTSGNITVPASSYVLGNILVNNISGYRPLGILGHNVTNWASGGQLASYCIPFAMTLYGDNIRYNLRNIHTSKPAQVVVECLVLYVKI